jgi:hypothetical protein
MLKLFDQAKRLRPIFRQVKLIKFNIKYLKMEKSHDEKRIQDLQDMAHKLRIHSIETTDTSGSGYIYNLTQSSNIMFQYS